LFACVPLFAAEAASDKADSAEHFQRFSAIPILGFSEETKLQYGAMALFFFKPDEKGGKVPEIDISAYGSTRGQFQFIFVPYYYLYHDKVSGWLDFRYQNWVANYFGGGNDPDFDEYVGFDREKFLMGAEIESKLFVPDQFKYGLEIHLEKSDIDFGDGKLTLPDTHSGWRNGAGYLLAYDTRDNTNWSRHGFLVQWQQMFYSDKLGDYSFDIETLDMRGFTELPFWQISMASGMLWQRTAGDAPFDMLAGPDGIKRFRGVESLYFSDKQALILQAELRKVLFWRLAGDIFFEGGKVGDHFSELMRNKWHHAIGFGGQLALNLSERLYARGEFSWIDNEKLGLTVYIREAF
ncbi:MAG: hypothetical protein HUK20_05635, partial [Fibrobacter sp.]|nr:hypothetical protein [Fibrobacter sp.]